MRSVKVDQYEFDDHGSEESLEIDLSRQSRFPHPDVKEFVASTAGAAVAAALCAPVPFYRVANRSQVIEYLKRFAAVEIPAHADWPTYVLEDVSWDNLHLVICAQDLFIRYRWSTSA